jgi:hypothetical protein
LKCVKILVNPFWKDFYRFAGDALHSWRLPGTRRKLIDRPLIGARRIYLGYIRMILGRLADNVF